MRSAKRLVKHEHHPNAAEDGQTANIKQNTTNKGYFRGRRLGWSEPDWQPPV